MDSKKGLTAISKANARVLILGSLPGDRSLETQQYYANPRNGFWRLMEQIVGVDPMAPYETKLRVLIKNRIALWDVCASATRRGSGDTAIKADSVVPNDFEGFLVEHPRIGTICFNGGKSKILFDRHVRNDLVSRWPRLRTTLLPSSSSAYASMSFQAKVQHWQRAIRTL